MTTLERVWCRFSMTNCLKIIIINRHHHWMVLWREEGIISKSRTTDLHGLGNKHFKVTKPSFDLHLILLKEVLITRQERGGGRAQIGLNAEGEMCDVFKDKTTDIERRHCGVAASCCMFGGKEEINCGLSGWIRRNICTSTMIVKNLFIS